MSVCPKCDGYGYTETWNDDQTDVVITLCDECSPEPVVPFGNVPAGLYGEQETRS